MLEYYVFFAHKVTATDAACMVLSYKTALRRYSRKNHYKAVDVSDKKSYLLLQLMQSEQRSSAVAERPRDASCHWIFC